MVIKIYIEGGGEGKYLEIAFQRAWTKFFQAAGLKGKMPRPIRGKGRKNTYDLFCTSIQNPVKDEIPLLLVDSEDPVARRYDVWQHLKARDGWDKPNNAEEKHAYLMVQVMETWLLADLDALQTYFGSAFKAKRIPAWANLEAVAKLNVFDALDKATAECGEKRYAKGKISFEVLGAINPELVKNKCPHAKRMLDFLSQPL